MPGCSRKIFAERLDALTSRYARRTHLASQVLQGVSLALGGRAGARLAETMQLGMGRMSLIRLLRALPEPTVAALTVLGVDDFAFRRGHTYGTVLVDMATHQVVDVLDERSADALAAWLRAHPGIQVIFRDRASCYAEGAARGAPQTIQVADRWHLLHNLSEAVRNAVAGQRRCLQAAVQDQIQPSVEPIVDDQPAVHVEGRLAHRTRTRRAEIHTLREQGMGIAQIASRLGLDRKTVRRFVKATDPDQLIGGRGSEHGSVLEPFKSHLYRRCAEDTPGTDLLLEEIRALGYHGSHRTLRRFLAGVRHTSERPPAPAAAPTTRDITSWIMRPEDKLTAEDSAELDRLCRLCPDLATIRNLAQGFTNLVRTRGGKHLEDWVQQAEQGDVSEIRSFANGLRKDWDAVKAGLTMVWSSGAVEGAVNRIKMIKRQIFGRANPDLLRCRILISD